MTIESSDLRRLETVRQLFAKCYNLWKFAEAALPQRSDRVRRILLVVFSSKLHLHESEAAAIVMRVELWTTKLSLAWFRANKQPQPHAKLIRGHENVSQSIFLTSRSLYSGRKRLVAPMS
jgi:hypothetical protein